MAFTSMLRRASSSLLPVARRAVGSPRSLRGGISTVLSPEKRSLADDIIGRSFVPSSRFFSSQKPAADKSLVQILQSEIECAEEPVEIEDVPQEFPFKIEDNLGERTIILRRVYQDETIEVEVDMPSYEEDDGEEGGGNDDDESNAAANMTLGVTISKGKGEKLEFQVFISPDELVIDNLSIKNPENPEDLLKYDGPDFSDLDESLQKAFVKYLEIRGIKPSIASFLQEYMTNKDNKEYRQWLKNLKSFVEK